MLSIITILILIGLLSIAYYISNDNNYTYSFNKSIIDNREYKGLILKNEIRVLLISDPDTKISVNIVFFYLLIILSFKI